jgi:hypothetical protein
MTFQRSWKQAVAVATVSLLGTSVGYAQGIQRSSDSPGMTQVAAEGNNGYGFPRWGQAGGGPLYIACWAEAESRGPAYFSATFESHAPWKARKEFRELVSKHYGPVSRTHCAGNPSAAKMEELVQQWKDVARAASNAVVNTGWEP